MCFRKLLNFSVSESQRKVNYHKKIFAPKAGRTLVIPGEVLESYSLLTQDFLAVASW